LRKCCVDPLRPPLFSRYYDAIYDRERGKRNQLTTLLDRHSADVNHIHEKVGLLLQSKSERAGDAMASLHTDELEAIAYDRLTSIGLPPDEAAGTARELVRAATHRLVLLVPKENDEVGFEVRSLQELMAAKALTTGDVSQAGERLAVIAGSPHWRNTWLFAAGALFARGDAYNRDALFNLLRKLDRDHDRLGESMPVVPRLAADLLEDGLTNAAPRWRQELLVLALQALDGTTRDSIPALAASFAAAADQDPRQRLAVNSRLQDACRGTPRQRVTAGAVLATVARRASGGDRAVSAAHMFSTRLTDVERKDSAAWLQGQPASPRGEAISVTEYLMPLAQEMEMDKAAQEIICEALDDLRTATVERHQRQRLTPAQLSTGPHPRLMAALDMPETAENLDFLLAIAGDELWAVVDTVLHSLQEEISRRPLADRLNEHLSKTPTD
jgi:hypothetical protein